MKTRSHHIKSIRVRWLRIMAVVGAFFCISASALDSAYLVDATGRYIGPVVSVRWPDNLDGATDAVDVAFKVGTRKILVHATDREFFTGSGRGIYFISTDCSGTPMINANAPSRPFDEYVVLKDLDSPSYFLWMRRPQAVIALRTVHSAKYYAGANAPCVAVNERINTAAAKSMVDIGTLFQPPFHLETNADVIDLLNPP